jgi:hypothetical protein
MMNERIKELAEQARQYAREYVADCKHYGHYMEHNELEVKFEEKFAELIVRECIRCCEGNSEYKNHTDTEWGKGLVSGIGLCKEAMKTHFGVEE